MSFRSASKHQIVAFLAIALMGLWGFVIFDRYSRESAALEAAASRTLGMAHAYAENTLSTIKRIDIVSRELSHVWATDPKLFSATFERLSDGIEDISLQTAVVDRDGWLVFSSLGLPDKPMNLADREHVKVHQGLTESRLFIGKPVVGRVSGRWSVQFTRAILREGRFDGVLVISISPEQFGRFYQAVSAGWQAGFTAVRGDGIVLSQSPEWEKYVGKQILDSPALGADRSLQGNYRYQRKLEGIDHIHGYYHLADYGVTLIAAVGATDVLSKVEEEMKTVERLAMAASLLLCTVALSIYRNLVLRERAEREINELNKSLELRVLERTATLQLKERELIDALTLNNNILLSSPLGIAAYREDGQCVLVNSAFADITGGSEAQGLCTRKS